MIFRVNIVGNRHACSLLKIYILLCFVLSLSCAKRHNLKNIPTWVRKWPVDEKNEWVYAVGYSPPAFFLKDTIKNAKNQARIELAKQIRVEVKATMLDIMINEKKTVGRKDEIVSVSETIVDEAVKNSQIVEVWHDKEGIVGEKGGVFALARIRMEDIKQEANKYIH